MALAGGLLLFAAAAAQASPAPPPEPLFTTSGAFFALSVADLEASVRWYRDSLGLAVVLRPPPRGGTAMAALEGGGLLVELIDDESAAPSEVGRSPRLHGLFKAGLVVDDWDWFLAGLERRGIPIAIGPFPATAEQRANLIIRDNEGNFLQFFGGYLSPLNP